MKMPAPDNSVTRTYLLLAAILVVSIVPYFWGLGKADIQDVDEAAYGEIAREMVASGDWVSPTLNGKPFDQHPPLGPWMMALSIKLFGATPLAVRLPNALLALVGLLITFSIGRRIAGREAGILAALALVTAPAYHLMVRDARLDMALMVFISLALWGVFSYLYEPRKYYLVLGYIGAALAFLTKGPIGLVVPLLVVGVFIILSRRWSLILRLGLPWGLALIAVMLIPWYWAMYRAHGSHYIYVLFIEQNFKRFATTNYAGKSDPFFYVHTFAWMFLPWFVAMIWQIARRFPALRRARFDIDRMSPKEPAPGLMTIWLIAPIVLMSFSQTKLPQYVFFVLPAAAVIAGVFLKDYIGGIISERGRRGFSVYTFALTLILLSAVVVVVTLMFPIPQLSWAIILGLVLVSLLGAALFSLIARKRASLVAVLCLTVGLVHLLITVHLSPAMLVYQPYKGFAEDLSAASVPDRDIYFVGKNVMSSFLFYSGRHAVTVHGQDYSALDEATRDGESVYIIAPEDVVPQLEEAGYSVEVLSTRQYFHTSLPTKKFLFAKTRAAAARPLILARLTRSRTGG
jgi:4-amino-4-deoxy-L-arabinose transferase-like glycosyltransferase